MRNLLVETPGGQRMPLSELAEIGTGEGPQTIFRENLMRRKIVLCNVVGRDIGGFVEEARGRIAAAVELPPGTHVTFGGQFEGQQRAMRQLGLFMGVVVLFSSFGSVWQSFLVLINVPTTLAGPPAAVPPPSPGRLPKEDFIVRVLRLAGDADQERGGSGHCRDEVDRVYRYVRQGVRPGVLEEADPASRVRSVPGDLASWTIPRTSNSTPANDWMPLGKRPRLTPVETSQSLSRGAV